jgi:hypothetical protein
MLRVVAFIEDMSGFAIDSGVIKTYTLAAPQGVNVKIFENLSSWQIATGN